jgi:hypothetical protein
MSKRNKKPRIKRAGIMKRWSGNSRPDRDVVREALKRAETCGTPMPPDRSTEASGRLQTMRAMWRDMLKQGYDKFNSIAIDENSRETVTRFFSGNRNFLVHTNKKTHVMRRSCEYYSAETMMKKYNYQQIQWVREFKPEIGFPEKESTD